MYKWHTQSLVLSFHNRHTIWLLIDQNNKERKKEKEESPTLLVKTIEEQISLLVFDILWQEEICRKLDKDRMHLLFQETDETQAKLLINQIKGLRRIVYARYETKSKGSHILHIVQQEL